MSLLVYLAVCLSLCAWLLWIFCRTMVKWACRYFLIFLSVDVISKRNFCEMKRCRRAAHCTCHNDLYFFQFKRCGFYNIWLDPAWLWVEYHNTFVHWFLWVFGTDRKKLRSITRYGIATKHMDTYTTWNTYASSI